MSMELDNSFTVPVPPDQAWDVLLDVERIAPCMPGATVDEFDGNVVNGRIKVKVGPVSLTYRGTAKFVERDPEAHVVVMEASGKETRGAGTASASVRAALAPDDSGHGTQVTMHTTMNVTGRPAQFGRGVMVEVGGKLVDQFAQNLGKLISGGSDDSAPAAAAPTAAGAAGPADTAPAADASPVSSGGSVGGAGVTESGAVNYAAPAAAATTTASPPAPAPAGDDSLNLVRLVGPAILKRIVPALLAAAGLALLGRRIWWLAHRGKQD